MTDDKSKDSRPPVQPQSTKGPRAPAPARAAITQFAETLSPDHASREAFSELFRAGTHHRSDQLIGASPLTMQRVWG